MVTLHYFGSHENRRWWSPVLLACFGAPTLRLNVCVSETGFIFSVHCVHIICCDERNPSPAHRLLNQWEDVVV